MGYHTELTGRFNLDRPLTPEHAATLTEFSTTRHEGPNKVRKGVLAGAIWCDWVPTEDLAGIEYNGNEKFYHYVEWLNYIIAEFLEPWGYRLNGKIQFQGETPQDRGTLEVRDNFVRKTGGR